MLRLRRRLQRETARGVGCHGVAKKVKGHVNFPQEFDQLLESIYDAVMVTDLRGRILVFNSRALDFFLLDYDEMLGKKVVEVISGADESLLQAISRNLEEHRYTLIEAHCVRKDKSMFPAEIAVNMLELFPDGNLCFFVRDITVRKRAQDALEDGILMGCDEAQLREVLQALVASLENPYAKKD